MHQIKNNVSKLGLGNINMMADARVSSALTRNKDFFSPFFYIYLENISA